MAFGSKNRVRAQVGVDGVSQSVGELGKFRAAFDQLATSKGAQTVLNGVGVGAGISAWGLLEKGIGKAVDVMGDSVRAASDQREALSLSAQVFEANTRDVERWAEGAADAFGQSKREALNYASEFGTAFKNVGMGLDDTTKRAEEMTHLAADLGSAFNRSSQEAAGALRSGLLGESEPLRAFGVFLDETKVKAKAAAMGLRPLHGELSDGQKIAARYQLIMEQTADSQGMFGRDADSLADSTKTLNAELEDLAAKLGVALTPALVDVTKATSDVVDAAGELPNPWSILETITFHVVELDGATETWAANTSDAAAEAAASWATGSERIAMSAGGLTTELEDLARANADAAADFQKVRDKAAAAGKKLEGYADDVRNAMKAVSDAAFGPRELRDRLDEAQKSLRDANKELQALERDHPNPTKRQRDDINEAQGRVHEYEQAVFDARGELLALDGMTTAELRSQIDWLNKKGLYSAKVADAMRESWQLALQAEGSPNVSGAHPNQPSSGNMARATGGYIPPGSWSMVGEEGPEPVHMLPGGGAYVTSGSQSAVGGGGGGGVPVEIPLVVDGRELARIVDRHLYYELQRAPQSVAAG